MLHANHALLDIASECFSWPGLDAKGHSDKIWTTEQGF